MTALTAEREDTLTVRRGSGGDAALVRHACAICAEQGMGDDFGTMWRLMAHDMLRFYVGERDGRAVTWVAVAINKDDAIFCLYGRRPGRPLAILSEIRSLWEFACEDLRGSGAQRASAWVSSAHPARDTLLKMYERLGFDQTGVSVGRRLEG